MTVSAVIDRDGLAALLVGLADDGYRVIGPTVRDGAVVHADIASIDDLPAGWRDEQDAGTYRLARRDDEALFGFSNGPHSWKQFLHRPRALEWRARRTDDGGMVVEEPVEDLRPLALVAARACDLAAIAVQDRVLAGGAYPDPVYEARRSGLFVVAVQCGWPGRTCFCASMGTGPRAEGGFDLALTELIDGGRHEFAVEVGSDRGAEVLARLPQRAPTDADGQASRDVTAAATAAMGRTLPQPETVPSLLARNLEHPRWDAVAERCLGCGNCTLVCPTCFCTTPEDVTDLTGTTSERWRVWDSCFNLEFSYMHGGSTRATTSSRYRQWLTHKLSTWWDQFGQSGCVGCGRCIAWCPVGIDLTAEVAAMAADPLEGTRP